MVYRTVCFGLLALLFALSGGLGSAYSGTTASAEEANVANAAVKARKLDSLLGREVSTRPDGDGGRIVDILIDQEGAVAAAVVEFGGFLGIGTRKIAVEWGAFRLLNGAIVVDVTRQQLRTAKEYKPNEPTAVLEAVRN